MAYESGIPHLSASRNLSDLASVSTARTNLGLGTAALINTPISLANGGTNANLTASNGGIFYSTATAGAILSGTATANQVLLSGSSTTPAWSTATYPATTTINQLLYSSSANTIVGLPTANSGVLATNGSGVPSITATPTVTSITITNAPSAGTDGANKAYVDLIAAGGEFKAATYAASTANLNATYLNGAAGIGATLVNAGALVAFAIDGTSPPINSRILVKDQSSQLQNGIYTLTTVGTGILAWVLTRATDYNTPVEIQPGDIVPVQNGTVNADTTWLETATVTTIGTDPIVFAKFQSAPITTTQYAVLVGGVNNSIGSVGPGATGTVLQGAGASANPAFSTATYPSIATGTGTLLRADGTNWVATTSTYPNTNAVNTLLYASSANVMAALATANNGILVTDGSGVPSISSTLPAAVQGNITSTGTITSGTWNGTTIDVPHGGTGNTTFTAYSIIAAGTTATGAFQNVSGVGTSGQVLTSNGAAALPTWQAVTAGAPSSLVSTSSDFVDDFFYGNHAVITTTGTQMNNWNVVTSGTAAGITCQGTAYNGHPGTIQLDTGSTLAGVCGLDMVGTASGSYTVTHGAIVFNCWIYIGTLSTSAQRFTVSCGLMDTTAITPSSSGIWFSAVDNVDSGKFQANTKNGGSSTTTSTAFVPVAATWYNLKISINAAGTSVDFTVNGTNLTTLTTNIPGGGSAMSPVISIIKTVGTTTRNLTLDLCTVNYVFTTPR